MNEISHAQSSLVEEDVPSTATERTIAEVWTEVLNLDEVGRHDNFFDLGGHSVLATQAVARLCVALSRQLPERALFDWPTVATLASALPDYPVSDQNSRITRR
ncbi:Phosphopantetheine attachment site [Micromonospora matsumotoense]|uniref:Phosphopantetheine attachment site n=1 Tax=Micromonospora matsumotoense TaxID=121616 RepID=A0A1C4Z7T8_9ACTN|nr:phosphopantetheine-binding protein [Micromonospora matsumotoense]SCF28986.1 Phosphopantetheine attachment site [Micromonospora matsumotoense]